jgi:hypothetical protein
VKKIDDKYLVVIDNETYMLGINAGGLCPWDPANPDFVDETNCGYTDKVLANSVVDIQTFRIWKDNRGVFALNPQTVKVNTTEIDFFLIQKSPKTESFSASEIELWENILLNGLR